MPGGSAPYHPVGQLLEISPGEFWGLTAAGGAVDKGFLCTVATDGSVAVLHEFNGSDGSVPWGGLTMGQDGFLYGVTALGGASGEGTLFRISTSGTLSALFSFSGTNGAMPRGPLAWGSDGSLYGVTHSGGANNVGTIFKFTAAHELITLASFATTNGADPGGGLVMGGDGRLYGTTEYGGSNTFGPYTAGTAYAVTTNGLLTVLMHFGGAKGAFPTARLCLGSSGDFYGTTSAGGRNGVGTVFKLTSSGQLDTLAVFAGDRGLKLVSGVTEGRDHALYGVTAYREETSGLTNGVLYRVDTNGGSMTLKKFGAPDGLYAFGELTSGSDGNLYGTLSDITLSPAPDGNLGSICRLVTLPTITSMVLEGGSATLTWNSFSNGVYRVEYASSPVDGSWTEYTGGLWTPSLTTTLQVPMLESDRGFYRVLLTP